MQFRSQPQRWLTDVSLQVTISGQQSHSSSERQIFLQTSPEFENKNPRPQTSEFASKILKICSRSKCFTQIWQIAIYQERGMGECRKLNCVLLFITQLLPRFMATLNDAQGKLLRPRLFVQRVRVLWLARPNLCQNTNVHFNNTKNNHI